MMIIAGVLSLWKGISPALLRQFLYTGLRMGIYEPIRNFFAFGGTKASDAPLLTKIMAGTSIMFLQMKTINEEDGNRIGIVAGGVSAAVFTPTDLLKVRMQGSSGQRYQSLLHAIKTVASEEKVSGLWKGMGPTSQRAAGTSSVHIAHFIPNAIKCSSCGCGRTCYLRSMQAVHRRERSDAR